MLSSAARAMCAASCRALMPTMVPRAYGSQCGAPRPAKCRHQIDPPLSLTLAASASISGAVRTKPRPSRIHCTTRADEDAASNAYSVRAPICQATVVTSRCFERVGGRADVLQQKAASAVRVLRHARLPAHLPEERRLLSPAMPAIGALSIPSLVDTRRTSRSTIAPPAACSPERRRCEQLVVHFSVWM